MMINEIQEDDFARHFLAAFADLECGSKYDTRNPQHVRWVRRRLAIHCFRGARFYACYAAEQVPVGFVSILIDKGLEGVRCFGQWTEILDLLVLEGYRGKGYGKALLEQAEKASVEAGACCMYVHTYAGNRAAMTFYIKHGFVPVAMLPDVNGHDDEGDVYLRKILEKTSSRD